MEEQFIRDRISKLREEKQVSERKMSLDLGHSTSYTQYYIWKIAPVYERVFIYLRISGCHTHGIFQ